MAIPSSWIAGSGSGRASRKQEMTSALLDVGCGTGAFSIGAALRGYRALGLSWDERNQSVAKERAIYCKAPSAQFEVLDIRELDRRADLVGGFDVVICLETIEHVMEDLKLMRARHGMLHETRRQI